MDKKTQDTLKVKVRQEFFIDGMKKAQIAKLLMGQHFNYVDALNFVDSTILCTGDPVLERRIMG